MQRVLRLTAPLLALAAVVAAQTAPAQSEGLAPAWDVRAVLKDISAHAGRLIPVLDKDDPASWAVPGAQAYAAQWKSLKEQAQALVGDALELAKNPEQLSGELKVFFRMQSIEFMAGSFAEGVRTYQGTAAAGDLVARVGENGANRERLQQYIVQLAAQREQEYQIMDHEAQRCRGMLLREPPARGKGKK
jgi:hypothetical protein